VPNYDDVDPFAGGDKTPSLKFPTIGTAYDCTVTEPPKLVQSRDYKTKELAFWPAKPGQTPNPKMAAVINVEVDGEEFSIWAVRPSAMFAALQEAQRTAGSRITPGGRLQIAFTHEAPAKNGDGMAKQYQARYTPPQAQPGADPFGDTQPAAQPPTRQQPAPAAPPWEQKTQPAQQTTAAAPF
jgi:hypothetical protein